MRERMQKRQARTAPASSGEGSRAASLKQEGLAAAGTLAPEIESVDGCGGTLPGLKEESNAARAGFWCREAGRHPR